MRDTDPIKVIKRFIIGFYGLLPWFEIEDAHKQGFLLFTFLFTQFIFISIPLYEKKRPENISDRSIPH